MVLDLITAWILSTSLVSVPGASPQCGAGAHGGQSFEVIAQCNGNGHSANGGSPASSPDPYERYMWAPDCTMAEELGFQSSGTCASCPVGTIAWAHFGLLNGAWIRLAFECWAETAPTVTPADAARAFQRIPLPHLRPIAQPATKTLVNFDTIFRVEAAPLSRHLTLLGQRVELAITPSSFDWTWGDGTTSTTTSPGAAYPGKDVVHRYLDADVTVRATVTVTWSARWRLNGGAWGDVPGNVRTTGAATALRVVEAVPHLSAAE